MRSTFEQLTMKHFLLSCVIALSIVGCRTKQSDKSEFAPEITISHTVQNPDIFAQLPEGFFKLDSILVVLSPRIGDGFGRLISRNSFQEVGHFGTQGKGPTEVIWASAFPYTNGGPDSSFMAYDLASRSVITYTLQKQGDSLTMRAHNKRQVDQGDNPIQNNLKICRFGENHYMGACFHHKDSLFSLIDKNLQQIGYFGDSPIPEQISNAAARLQGHFVSAYDITLYVPFQWPYIACYTSINNQPVKLWEDDFAEKIYKIQAGKLTWEPKQTRGRTEDVKIGKQYIYILWYDDLLYNYIHRKDPMAIPGADVILIYDHDGNRIARLRTDIDLYNIELSEDERTLYALTAPNCELVTFELPEKYPVE